MVPSAHVACHHASAGRGQPVPRSPPLAAGGPHCRHHHSRVTRQQQNRFPNRANVRGRGNETKRLGAAHSSPTSGYRFHTADGTLTVGDSLDQDALYAELEAAVGAGRNLMIQAERPSGSDRKLVLIISAVPFSTGPRLWAFGLRKPKPIAWSSQLAN